MDSKDYFDTVAQQWDAMRKSFFSDAVRDKALSLASVQSGQVAADLGAGTGFVSEGLIARGLRVIAVDQSEEMLAEMRRKFKGHPGVECRAGSAEQLPLPDASVDHAFANMYLHHVEDPASAIHEMARVVKPGGKLVITDLDLHGFEFLRSEQHDRWMGFKREDVRSWFEQAGLAEVKVECAGEECCATSSGGEKASVSIFVAMGKKGPCSDIR